MAPEEWLAEQIKAKGLKQKHIVQHAAVRLTAQKLSASLSGRRHFTVPEYLAVCRVIDVNPLDCPLQEREVNESA